LPAGFGDTERAIGASRRRRLSTVRSAGGTPPCAKVGELTLVNDILSGALGKAGLLPSAKR
jgi:hypothetical protein